MKNAEILSQYLSPALKKVPERIRSSDFSKEKIRRISCRNLKEFIHLKEIPLIFESPMFRPSILENSELLKKSLDRRRENLIVKMIRTISANLKKEWNFNCFKGS